MNQTNHFVFTIYLFLLNLRDTMEYAIDREHSIQLYNQRKNILTNGYKEGSPLGGFFAQNQEQAKQIVEKLDEFVQEVYGDDSSILKISEDKVRVDHTQHIKLFDYVCGLQESIRDILYGYLNFTRQNNTSEEVIVDLLAADDRMYRPVFVMLAFRELQKSFAEFQKVMSESKGQPTPQSNFIVQNEISKLAQMIRFAIGHHHCVENEIMDVMDEVNALIEMTEGRRERRDNKSFKDLFDGVNLKLNGLVAKYEPLWKEAYNKALKEAQEFEAQRNNAKLEEEAPADKA